MYVMNEFLTANSSCTTKYFFLITVVELCSPHLCASFGTLFIQIGQLFESQRVFEVCLKKDKSLSSKQNVINFGILPNV